MASIRASIEVAYVPLTIALAKITYATSIKENFAKGFHQAFGKNFLAQQQLGL